MCNRVIAVVAIGVCCTVANAQEVGGKRGGAQAGTVSESGPDEGEAIGSLDPTGHRTWGVQASEASAGAGAGSEAARGVAAVTGAPHRVQGAERITPAISSRLTGTGSRTSSGI